MGGRSSKLYYVELKKRHRLSVMETAIVALVIPTKAFSTKRMASLQGIEGTKIVQQVTSTDVPRRHSLHFCRGFMQ